MFVKRSVMIFKKGLSNSFYLGLKATKFNIMYFIINNLFTLVLKLI